MRACGASRDSGTSIATTSRSVSFHRSYGPDFFGDRLQSRPLPERFGAFDQVLDCNRASASVSWRNPVLQRSEGEITITSSDPQTHPEIDLNYYGDPHDLKQMVAAMRLAHEAGAELARAGPGPVVRAALTSPASMVIRMATSRPMPFLEKRRTSPLRFSIYHQCGTCRIGDVVDPQLRVLGIAGLRVADASIMPDIISANTNAALHHDRREGGRK